MSKATSIMNIKAPSTPKRKRRVSTEQSLTPSLVTPSKHNDIDEAERTNDDDTKACRQLSMPAIDESDYQESPMKRSYFGRNGSSEIASQPNTRQVYALVNKMTGSIGGNGHGGAIYGELTVGSMQKMVELMKVHTNLGPDSRFIDVGSGLGKPNMHVTQDPGVEFSYGIEMEHVRWMLGMCNLRTVLQKAYEQETSGKDLKKDEQIRHRCVFAHGDITEANYFDPFTHVYMFDIGFPPKLFKQLGQMFNKSQSDYLICYHGPKLMVDRYGFNVELIVQAPTSMHGSSEGHTGYIYRRTGKKQKVPKRLPLIEGTPCDPLFKDAWESTRREVKPLLDDVTEQVTGGLNSPRPRRKRTPVNRDPYTSCAK